MGGTREWFKHDAWFLADDKIRDLGHEFGPAGPLLAEALLELAKRQKDGGRVTTRWSYLAEHAFVRGRPAVRRIVDRAEHLRFVQVESQDETRVTLSLPKWREIQGAGLDAEQGRGARRMALHRNPEMRQRIRTRDGGQCRYCGTVVQWTNRRGSDGGTYDHVDPEGPTDETNLVVACRGCNARKKDRMLEQVAHLGMALRPEPGSEIQNGSRSELDPDLDRSTPEEEVETEEKGFSSPTSTDSPLTSARSAADRTERERQKASPEDRRLCRTLAELIKARNPKAKIKSEAAWLRSMRLIREEDGNSIEDTERLIRWTFADPGKDAAFWADVIQSPSALREHYAQMWPKMVRPALVPAVEGSAEFLARRAAG